MEKNAIDKQLRQDPIAYDLFKFLEENKSALSLEDSQFYYDFPVLKNLDEAVVISRILLVSRNYGVVIIDESDVTTHGDINQEIEKAEENIEQVFTLLFSRLIRNKQLRKTKTELNFPISSVIFAPNIRRIPKELVTDTVIINTYSGLHDFFSPRTPFPQVVYDELIATIEGAKGLIRPKLREITDKSKQEKGYLANKLEAAISSFDQKQKHGYMGVLDGLQRIRGLAGSGKTVVLAMKAALTHLRYPDSEILYTFYTKSLYQHIQRLITRFYRQFDDRDPDWEKLHIMHAWGGYNNEGVYFNTCIDHGVQPMTFTDASKFRGDAFTLVCKNLLKTVSIKTKYDYIFIDEGQDFPASFIQLCLKLTTNNRVVFAYDDLQTIFQPSTPTITEIVGADKSGMPQVELTADIILYKCYRNPREIIVCAHALGFGIYSQIVQMLENKEQWEDIGYKVVSGEFVEGNEIVIERPISNSLTVLSEYQEPLNIVKATAYSTYDEEVQSVARSIKSDIDDGLRPDDILVIVVDDRHAKDYLKSLNEELYSYGINCNNIHTDSFGIRDFQKDGCITLSTVHKAKGNESYMVYVIGVDALFSTHAGVKERNVLFTAMTRAKGWVRVSGVGLTAEECKREIDEAMNNFPFLRFKYPGEELKILKRDLAANAIKKQQNERKLDELMEDMSPEEIKKFIEQRQIKKGRVK